jgi:DnaJ family protein C protein 19
MIPVFLGIVALVAVFYLLRWFSNADPKNVRKTIPWGAIGAAVLVLIVLAGTGRIDAALAGLAALMVWGMRVLSMIQMGKRFKDMFRKTRDGDAPPNTGEGAPPPRKPSSMTVTEAYSILGLQPGASDEDIKAAYRRVIGQLHPDRGGTDYLAAKVNHARDVLLGGK